MLSKACAARRHIRRRSRSRVGIPFDRWLAGPVAAHLRWELFRGTSGSRFGRGYRNAVAVLARLVAFAPVSWSFPERIKDPIRQGPGSCQSRYKIARRGIAMVNKLAPSLCLVKDRFANIVIGNTFWRNRALK
jgi:hypothetical protein